MDFRTKTKKKFVTKKKEKESQRIYYDLSYDWIENLNKKDSFRSEDWTISLDLILSVRNVWTRLLPSN